MTIVVEAAVDSLDDAMAAVEGGADRLELCANLAVGGTTPDPELIAAVVGLVDIPVFAMIRPRGGSFVYSASELEQMRRDVGAAIESGAAGIVLGVLDQERRIDVEHTRSLVTLAGGAPVTFHRAFDRTPDLLASADALMSLGVSRVLTSGGAATASEGADGLAALVAHCGTPLGILAGGGVRAGNVAEIVRRTGVHEVHARCEGDAARIRAIRDVVRAGASGA
ncbi:MAG: Copper homeostasis protein cutC [Gemmatimonadetes bacterium]|nr:Copper homeostasis protein cutC [Gemmatimonadota bacterium]